MNGAQGNKPVGGAPREARGAQLRETRAGCSKKPARPRGLHGAPRARPARSEGHRFSISGCEHSAEGHCPLDVPVHPPAAPASPGARGMRVGYESAGRALAFGTGLLVLLLGRGLPRVT